MISCLFTSTIAVTQVATDECSSIRWIVPGIRVFEEEENFFISIQLITHPILLFVSLDRSLLSSSLEWKEIISLLILVFTSLYPSAMDGSSTSWCFDSLIDFMVFFWWVYWQNQLLSNSKSQVFSFTWVEHFLPTLNLWSSFLNDHYMVFCLSSARKLWLRQQNNLKQSCGSFCKWLQELNNSEITHISWSSTGIAVVVGLVYSGDTKVSDSYVSSRIKN